MSAFGAPKHEDVISPVRHVRPLTVRATTWQNYNARKALNLLRVRRRMLAKLAKLAKPKDNDEWANFYLELSGSSLPGILFAWTVFPTRLYSA